RFAHHHRQVPADPARHLRTQALLRRAPGRGQCVRPSGQGHGPPPDRRRTGRTPAGGRGHRWPAVPSRGEHCPSNRRKIPRTTGYRPGPRTAPGQRQATAAGPGGLKRMLDMNKLTVLLVDDHEGFINAAMRHFRKIDWLQIVGSAGNGLEAIERSESLRPQVVLMDLAMPEMGGLQATRLIKSQDDAPYIVIASHYDDVEHREHALRAGADNFVSKLSYIQEVMPILE